MNTDLSAMNPRLQFDQLHRPVLDAVFAYGQDVPEPDVERDGAFHEADRDLPRFSLEQAPWQGQENVLAGV